MKDDIYSAICREALESRQRDLGVFVDNGMAGMSTRLEKTLLRLPSGYFLLGLGPYNAGLVKLDEFDELLIGREVPEYIGVGMPVTGFRVSSPEAFLNVEVSRLHAKVFRKGDAAARYLLVDMRSTCGTYLNGDPIPVPDDLGGVSEDDCARPLTSGDFFSLGPSAVNLFLFFQK
jgi:FHA domain